VVAGAGCARAAAPEGSAMRWRCQPAAGDQDKVE
jgi:hypothetical protein